MSEFEGSQRPPSSTAITTVIVGIVLVVGCLIVCGGLAAVGLMLPMRQRQAEAAARQAQINAAQRARAAEAGAKAQAADAAAKSDTSSKEGTAEPGRAEGASPDQPDKDREGEVPPEPPMCGQLCGTSPSGES